MRYVVVVVYVGTEAAATTLVATAETNLTAINDLTTAIATATGGAITATPEVRLGCSHCNAAEQFALMQPQRHTHGLTCGCVVLPCLPPRLQGSTTGSVSGGTTPVNTRVDATVSLLRSGPTNLQTNTTFFLTAVYAGTTGTAQEGVAIAGELPPCLFPCHALRSPPAATNTCLPRHRPPTPEQAPPSRQRAP